MQQTIGDFAFAIDLLEALLDDGEYKEIILVICSTRTSFLRQIAPSILAPQVQEEIPASQDDIDEDDNGDDDNDDAQKAQMKPHRFLIPTLGLLASAQSLKMIFCPSVKALRASLSTLTTRSALSLDPEDRKRNLIIVDLVLLHRDTSEFSAQGLSRTFACAVEAAARNGMNVRLVECKDIHRPSEPNRGFRLWDAQVPLLSGSVRLGGEGASWAGREIKIKSVAGRWFSFEERRRPDSGNIEMKEENDAMLV